MDLDEKELTYSDDGEHERLDVFVSRAMGELTRSTVRRLIETGFVTVDGKYGKPSLKLKGGERISVRVPPPVPATPDAEQIPLEILFEDSDIIVVNKAAGMVVHPGAGNRGGTLVNALLGHCRDLSGIGGEIRPGIVHRIDKDTTGILVVAKNDNAHLSLARQFKQHSVKRVYTALVYGSPREEKGVIDAAIGRHPTDRKKMSGATRRGRHAVTNWRVAGRYRGITLMTITLETGRTHQIRVHLSEAGYPLLGDPVYGGSGRLANLREPALRKMIKELGRQALHAGTLGIIHPATGEYLEFNAALPEDMAGIIQYLEKSG
ncbi:MAG TPA: RluA family pseudouridine synthase [Geobacteraceae bacterium]|nr:RluA family pseudouridine synthase [Geobacteraceae bacterium]